MTIKTHAIVLACLLSLSACASGSDASMNPDDTRAVRELTQSLQDQEGRLRGLPPLSEADAACVAKGLADSPGTDALVKYGVLTSDMQVSTLKKPLAIPREPAKRMVDSVLACVDLAGMQRDEMAEDDDPPAVKKCFASVMDESGVRRILLSGLTGDNKALRAVNVALSNCLAKAA